jgi:P pilus assembly chaperone PapD
MNDSIYMKAELRCWKTVRSVAVCALALFASGIASAATWAIDPVRVELSPQQQTAAITIKNNSNLATTT